MSSLVADARRIVKESVPRDLTRSQKVTIAALVMITIQLAFRTWAVWGSWFLEDDFIFLTDVARGETGVGWLFTPHDVHFMPLSLLMTLPVGSFGAYNWPLAAVEILLLQAAAGLSCWWMLRHLFGNRLRILVPLAFYLFCAASMPSVMWWATAINQIPAQVVLFSCVALHVDYLRTRRLRVAILSGVVLVLGLACYEKAILVPMVLAVLTAAYFASGGLVARVRHVLARYWPAWALYGAIGIGYLVTYRTLVPGGSGLGGDRPYGAMARTMILEALGPTLVGGPWRWNLAGEGPRVVADPPTAMVTVSWIIVVALCFYVYARYERALRPLWFAVPYIAISYLIILSGRGAAFGPTTGLDIRYWSDLTPVVALAIALTTMSIVGSREGAAPRSAPLMTVGIAPRHVVAATSIFVVGATYSSVGIARPWHDDYPARAYVQTGRDELQSADGIALIDTAAPTGAIFAATFPYNLTSRLFAPVGSTFTTPASGNDLSILDPVGNLARPTVEDGTRDRPAKDEPCGHLVKADDTSSIRMEASTFDYPFWMSISYLAGSNGELRVVAGDNDLEAPVIRGAHTLWLRTEGSYSRVRLESSGTDFCAEEIAVGPARAQARP